MDKEHKEDQWKPISGLKIAKQRAIKIEKLEIFSKKKMYSKSIHQYYQGVQLLT